ncbi:GNAT family N-acetyltransferase [Haloglomus litoreum]|uniref:GNAT family N-acetyltransferase n=1 Tax=Haloglomus litoreum TaxID=3034026 RepID=UPI0023E7D7D3|nr:GNAT family N-acetyltransferase [Haloglomus sp. DT116]
MARPQHRTEPGRVTVQRCTDPTGWDAFVRDNDGTPFALWGWGDAVETYPHDRWYLTARAEDDIVGGLPLFHIESRLFGDKLVSLPFTSQGALLASGPHAEAATRALLDRAIDLSDDLGVDFASIRATDLGERERFTHRNRFVTFRVPLDDGPGRVWERVKSSRQRQIQGAREDDALTFEVGTSLSALRDFYDLYLRSMRGHGSPPHTFEFFRVLWDRLHDDGHLRLGLVRHEGDVINGVIDLALGERVIQKGVVTDFARRDLNGGSLIHWKSLEWAAENGYRSYNLGRTREASGVYIFKKSFGGEKVWIDDYHYFPDGETQPPDPEDRPYDLARRAWRRLPIPVTRVVGPKIRRGLSL